MDAFVHHLYYLSPACVKMFNFYAFLLVYDSFTVVPVDAEFVIYSY